MPFVKPLPASDFYAIIFSSAKADDFEGYADELTLNLAAPQPGYPGYESVNNLNNGIFISNRENHAATDYRKHNATHQLAKSGAMKLYRRYLLQICRV